MKRKHLVCDNFDEIITNSKKIILYVAPYFATAIQYVKYYLIDDIKDPKLKKGSGTAFTDGKDVYFHRSFVETLTQSEFNYLFLHELLHIVLNHVIRMKVSNAKNSLKHNVACDLFINSTIDELNSNINTYTHKFEQPVAWSEAEKKYIQVGINGDSKYLDMSVEEIYKSLPDEDYPQITMIINPDGSVSLDSSSGLSQEEIQGILDKYASGDLMVQTVPSNKQKDIEERNKRIQTNIRVMSSTHRGVIPNSLLREIDNLLKSEIDWRVHLKDYLQSFPNDYNYLLRDRRFMMEDFVLPSFDGEQIKLVIGIDTSGSISINDLTKFMSEVYSICEQFGNFELTLIDCDSEIKKDNIKVISNFYELSEWKPKGNGGTSFKPVFEYVESELPNTMGIIYFTDGYGEFPEKTRLKTLWVLCSDLPEKDVPFGKVIHFKNK